MTPLIFFAIVVLVPAVVLTILRVNAAVIFLSLCLGSVLIQFLGSDTINFVTAFSPHASNFNENSIEIGLLMLPAVLTTIFMFHSVKRMRVLFNIVPALTVGFVGLLLIEPLLSPGLNHTLTSSSLWQHYSPASGLIVGTSALISLVYLWFDRRNTKVVEAPTTKHSKD